MSAEEPGLIAPCALLWQDDQNHPYKMEPFPWQEIHREVLIEAGPMIDRVVFVGWSLENSKDG